MSLEEILTICLFKRRCKEYQEREKQKEEVKKKYGCENSTLDFHPKTEHIEKVEYKGKIAYIVVKNT